MPVFFPKVISFLVIYYKESSIIDLYVSLIYLGYKFLQRRNCPCKEMDLKKNTVGILTLGTNSTYFQIGLCNSQMQKSLLPCMLSFLCQDVPGSN